MIRNRTFQKRRSFLCTVPAYCFAVFLLASSAMADQSLESRQSWKVLDGDQMSMVLRGSLDDYGALPAASAEASERFRQQLEQGDDDPLDAFVSAVASLTEAVERLAEIAAKDPLAAAASIDPSAADYAEIESLPKPIRMSVRTWLGRLLVRSRLYDEALPVIAEVDVTESVDPASSLFYRGACYHALLMKNEALADLRMLLENEQDCPVRFSRLAKLMVADIKPLKEDSLDEISRLMTDVTRRLDLGRSDETVENQEQKIIDKLTKLIDKLEEQQQQQQQQQQSGGSGSGGDPQSGQESPMQDSQIAGGSGDGNVKKKNLGDDDGWGNLPPAERKEALQKISRDLPTHYRDAIEAYFRKRATDG
ncbi:hypothetical protein [Stieleria maiorica]|nr:hypothetical protein [Stieleria maiorica]